MAKLPEYIQSAILCGPKPKLRNWRRLNVDKLTRAERIMTFAETYLRVPEGTHQGKPFKLDLFQEVFLYAVFDNPEITRVAILSMGRKNGKTVLCAIIILCFLIGPEAETNSQVSSGAMSREQAALVFNHMLKFINNSPELENKIHVTPSGKRLRGLVKNVEYQALAKDANTVVGRSDLLIIGDEWGKIIGPADEFVTGLTTGQGAFEDPLLICISTQSPTDADLLSVWIDDAKDSKDPHTVCHVYAADEGTGLDDKRQWKKANPALDVFRSRRDLSEQLEKASRLPALEGGARNLLLNQRISADSLWLAKSVWSACNGSIDIDVFRTHAVSVGIDLSARVDLTAAVAAAKDSETNIVHLLPFVFCPADGLIERSRRDKVPYDAWVKAGYLKTIPGASINYDQMAKELLYIFDREGIDIDTIEFDRWRIDVFQAAAERVGFADNAEWNEVGQGYKDFSPRCEAFQSLLLEEKVRHGGHPLLTMAASNAIVVRDPAGSIKLDKSKSTQRIDPLVAAVMAAFPVSEGNYAEVENVELWIA